MPQHTQRRGILPLLWSFAFLSYLLRTNIAIAQQQMSHELGLTDIQIGYVFSAFLLGYTIFQVPAGILGDRFGPRLVLAISGVWWGATTLLTGLVPGLLLRGTGVALTALLILRVLHGIGEASTYPVAMTAVADWFPPARHAFINSLIFTGSTLGAAFAPPLIAHLMTAVGWRATFYWTSLPPILLGVVWGLQATMPRRPGIASRGNSALANWKASPLNRNALLLCASYCLYCYAISIFVYWLFKYLMDVRHLSVINSGWATSLPWIVASGAVPLLGYVSTRVSSALGILSGRRLVATLCLVIAAGLMFLAAEAQSITVTIAAIALAVSLLFSTESSYWSTAIDIAPANAGGASGLMNLAGNLGGVASTALVPVLVHSFGWFTALVSGSLFALVAAAAWFLLHGDRAAIPETASAGVAF